jgi:DNA repair protein RadC
MASHMRELPDRVLEDILLVGARGLHHEAPARLADALATRYAATPEHRRECLRMLLSCANELQRRLELAQIFSRTEITSPGVVREYLKAHFKGLEHEAFAVVFLDSPHRVIAVEEMFRGTLTMTSVYPREVVKRALSYNAAAVVLAHNHPSGLAEPSRADEYLTATLKSALALVDVKTLDHIVVGAATTTSFAERGLL